MRKQKEYVVGAEELVRRGAGGEVDELDDVENVRVGRDARRVAQRPERDGRREQDARELPGAHRAQGHLEAHEQRHLCTMRATRAQWL